MKKFVFSFGAVLFGVVALTSIAFALTTGDEFEEEETAVGGLASDTSEDDFKEEGTGVGTEPSENQVAGEDEFGEEVTTVGDPTSEEPSDEFGEEETTVGTTDTTPETIEETVVETTSSSRRGGGSRSGGSRNTPSPVVLPTAPQGEVLGATTDSGTCTMLTTYMKIGLANDPEEVKILQIFLNQHVGAMLPITGYFGPLTDAAVKKFQLQFKDQILQPWVELGMHPAQGAPTGYVYKTTQYTINKLLCPTAEIAMPVLN